MSARPAGGRGLLLATIEEGSLALLSCSLKDAAAAFTEGPTKRFAFVVRDALRDRRRRAAERR
jgi:hypothetical protein